MANEDGEHRNPDGSDSRFADPQVTDPQINERQTADLHGPFKDQDNRGGGQPPRETAAGAFVARQAQRGRAFVARGRDFVAEQATSGWLKQRYDKIPTRQIAGIALACFALSAVLRGLGIDNAIVSLINFVTLLAICLLLLKLGPWFRSEFARAMRAMWMPLAVTIGAAALLFYQGQGRDLGVGLLGERYFQIFMLCPILIYWALNNWHSARLGLNYEFGELTGEEFWVFWPPRVLGVCAHMAAALSLALAAWSIVTGPGTNMPSLVNCLVFAAPIIIALVTWAMWTVDVAYLSKRKKLIKPDRAKRHLLWIMVLVVVLLGVVAIFEYVTEAVTGLTLATLSISASAAIFLFCVSRGRRTFNAAAESHADLTLYLIIPTVLILPVVWFAPTVVGSALGSLNVCFLAFGAVLATINGIGWFGTFVVEDMNDRAQRFKFAGQCMLFLLLLASLTSMMRSYHRVRLCATSPCAAAPAPSKGWQPIPDVAARPGIAEAALAWYEQADRLYHEGGKNAGKPVPMLIIATAGGGIRAAYWTATVLGRLEADLATKGLPLDKFVFAISGVSGGSVGAMNYIAARHFGEQPTGHLHDDFLAPAIASLVFTDAPSNFLPDFGQFDRGAALELAFERGSKGRLNHSFLSFFPRREDLQTNWRPALFLNATHQETGRRIITSNLMIEKDTFLDSFDELSVLASDIRASTAAHNSARFTYVSPAGKLLVRTGQGKATETINRGYVIDGGYFENYGAATALELARNARSAIRRKGHEVKLVVLQISSDPELTKGRTRVRTLEEDGACFLSTERAGGVAAANESVLRFNDAQIGLFPPRWNTNDGEGPVVSFINELTAPLIGIAAVREARGRLAAAALASAICAERNTIWFTRDPQVTGSNARPNSSLTARASQAASDSASQTKSEPDLTAAEAPHFSHLAMCAISDNVDPAGRPKPSIVPPLGWVLSKPLRDKFPAILDDCGNERELARLEAALD
ncbi:hypothetical protein ACQR16_27840 [Bradyrhizobium oligotrophicum]|uniref:hypothetical protein n=1 Tax=Bradyrhizobium oligotrophicum TaxID=44255 RepID=UPI003EB78711